jgi:glutamate carboxypeptidase
VHGLLQALRAEAVAARGDYVATLARLVSIDSGSDDVAGVERVGDLVAERLLALGFEVDRPRAGGSASAILARRRGAGPARVLLCGHLDTVFPRGTAARRPFTVDGDHATGPGVSDDKGGLLAGVVALEVLDRVAADRDDVPALGEVTVLLTPDEEVGSPSVRDLLGEVARSHDVGLCLECAREDGRAVVGRKGIADAVVEVHGREAHAGIEPERGVSAAVEAAHVAVGLDAMNARWPDVTVNVGVLRAGSRPNVVAGRGTVVADLRAASRESFDAAVGAMRTLTAAPTLSGARLELSLDNPAPPWAPDDATWALADHARYVARQLGWPLGFARTGGAADANLLAAAGLTVLDGLGPVGGGDHGEDEWLDLATVPDRVALLAGLVVRLNAPGP